MPFYEAHQKTSFQSFTVFRGPVLRSLVNHPIYWSLLQINVDCSNTHIHPHRPNVTMAAEDRSAPRRGPERHHAHVPGPRQALGGTEGRGQTSSPESVHQTMPPPERPLDPWALLFLNCQVRESNSVSPRSVSLRGLL